MPANEPAAVLGNVPGATVNRVPSQPRELRVGPARAAPAVRSPLKMAVDRFTHQPVGIIGMTVLAVFVVLAVAAPLVAPYDPLQQFPDDELQPPGAQFWLGSDHLGRDVFSRIVYGTRISLVVGVLAVALGAGIGGGSGLVAGYAGGKIDVVIMRIWEAVFAFPAILLGIAFAAAFGASVANAAVAIGIATMPAFARNARASVLVEREKEYVQAARGLGARAGRILTGHVLPNSLGPLLVQVALAMGAAVLLEAGLSFLGLGAQPPQPSWGSMLSESRLYLRQAPWFGVWPGTALAVFVLGLNSFADALRDALDPRLIR